MTRSERWLWLDQVREQVREKTLSSHAGHVALVLGVHYANGTGEAWPSQRELAAVTALSERTVRKALQELRRQGLLGVRHGPPASTFGCVYRLRNPVTGAGFGKRESETA